MQWEEVDATDHLVIEAASYLVQIINKITESQRSICEKLKLGEIMRSAKFEPNKAMLKFRKSKSAFVADMSDNTSVSFSLYQIKISTEPGSGHFEASLQHDTNNKRFSVEVTEDSHL